MAMIELVDFNEVYNNVKEIAKKSTRRGRTKKITDESEIAAEETSLVSTEEKATEAKSGKITEKKVDNSNDSLTDEADKK